ncbi:MAG TPA: hypothetical protein VMT72_22290 [Pseudolabrys sp.]|nr:hypothetical protein [Pseudolabrys sp.]
MELLIAACLVGIVFGLNCNFLIVIPLTLAVIIASGVGSVSQGHTILEALTGIAISAVSLQGGYMIGLTSRDLLSQTRSRFHAAPSRRV